MVVESNNNPKAIGDNGKAFGILQIHKGYVNEVNNLYKTNYKHKDMFCVKKSKEVTKKYLSYWGKVYAKTNNKQPTKEVLSKIHNGGPKGYLKPETKGYWLKVKKV